jgi:hypothetical protein
VSIGAADFEKATDRRTMTPINCEPLAIYIPERTTQIPRNYDTPARRPILKKDAESNVRNVPVPRSLPPLDWQHKIAKYIKKGRITRYRSVESGLYLQATSFNSGLSKGRVTRIKIATQETGTAAGRTADGQPHEKPDISHRGTGCEA